MKILITGGAGRIGRSLRAQYAGAHELVRVLDVADSGPAGPGEEIVAADIADLAAMERAMQGIDAVVHLAGIPVEAPMDQILRTNIEGCWNIYEAARRAGAKRIVFGSSNHAVGFYPVGHRIDPAMPIRPDTRYGLSKCWGEAVGSLYADKYGVTSLHIRIGSFLDEPMNKRHLSLWISPRDLGQLVRIGLTHPAIHNTIVFGISRNSAAWYDNADAYALGYAPQDRSEDHHDAAMRGEADLTHAPASEAFQGGPFAAIEFAGRLPGAR